MTIRTCEEFLSCVSLCIHLNGVSHTCVAFVYVCSCVGWVCMSVCDCRGQRNMSGVLFHYLSAYALETGSHTEPETHHFSDATWLASSHLSLLSTAGITGTWGQAYLLHGCWGSEFGSSWSHSKHSYPQSCLHGSLCYFFLKKNNAILTSVYSLVLYLWINGFILSPLPPLLCDSFYWIWSGPQTRISRKLLLAVYLTSVDWL